MSGLRHAGAGLVCGLLALAPGCDSGGPNLSPVASERGVGSPTDVTGPTRPPALPALGGLEPGQGRTPPPSRAPRDRAALPASPGGGMAAQETTTTAADPDYSSALRTAFGTPTECISAETRRSLQGTLTIRVSVRATPSGRVTSASVSGAGLSGEDVACLTRHADAVRLPSPLRGAPRTVTTTVDYTVRSTPGTPGTESAWVADWGPSSPTQGELPPGAQAPGTVLPALAPAGPAPGSVPPGSTLPALAPPGPAPGSVPPSSTLPAVVE